MTDGAFKKLFWTDGEKLLPDLDFCVSGLKTNPNVVSRGRALEYFVEQMDETIRQLPNQNFREEIDVNIGVKCGSKRNRKAKLDELGQKGKDFEEKILRYVETVNDCRRKAKYKDQRRPGLIAQVSSYASNTRINDIAPEQISGEQLEKAVNELMKCYSQHEEQLKALQGETALPPFESYCPQFDLLLWKHLYNASS